MSRRVNAGAKVMSAAVASARNASEKAKQAGIVFHYESSNQKSVVVSDPRFFSGPASCSNRPNRNTTPVTEENWKGIATATGLDVEGIQEAMYVSCRLSPDSEEDQVDLELFKIVLKKELSPEQVETYGPFDGAVINRTRETYGIYCMISPACKIEYPEQVELQEGEFYRPYADGSAVYVFWWLNNLIVMTRHQLCAGLSGFGARLSIGKLFGMVLAGSGQGKELNEKNSSWYEDLRKYINGPLRDNQVKQQVLELFLQSTLYRAVQVGPMETKITVTLMREHEAGSKSRTWIPTSLDKYCAEVIRCGPDTREKLMNYLWCSKLEDGKQFGGWCSGGALAQVGPDGSTVKVVAGKSYRTRLGLRWHHASLAALVGTVPTMPENIKNRYVRFVPDGYGFRPRRQGEPMPPAKDILPAARYTINMVAGKDSIQTEIKVIEEFNKLYEEYLKSME